MSIKVMTAVWEHSQHKGGALNLMLAIADFADDSGGAFPGIPRLAKKIRMTQRNTQLLIRKLEDSGELTVRVGVGPHGANHYHIHLDRLGKKASVKPTKPAKQGEKNAPPPKTLQGEKTSDAGVKNLQGSEREGGESQITRSTMHDPSIKPSMHADESSIPNPQFPEPEDGWMDGQSYQALWTFGVRDAATLKRFAAVPLAIIEREIALIQRSRAVTNPPAALVRNLKHLPATAWHEQPPAAPATQTPIVAEELPAWLDDPEIQANWVHMPEQARRWLQSARYDPETQRIVGTTANVTTLLYQRYSYLVDPICERLRGHQ